MFFRILQKHCRRALYEIPKLGKIQRDQKKQNHRVGSESTWWKCLLGLVKVLTYALQPLFLGRVEFNELARHLAVAWDFPKILDGCPSSHPLPQQELRQNPGKSNEKSAVTWLSQELSHIQSQCFFHLYFPYDPKTKKKLPGLLPYILVWKPTLGIAWEPNKK